MLNSRALANRTGIDIQQPAPVIKPIKGTKVRYFNFLFKERIIAKLEVTSMEINSPKEILYSDKSTIRLGGINTVIVGLNSKDKPKLTKFEFMKGVVKTDIEKGWG